jgi:DNA-binding FadR family transcriptional regulator
VLEHVAIIDAVVARDPDAAEQAVRSHLLSVIDALRNLSPSESGPPTGA